MSRRMDAPVGHECPYRHQCPHLDHLSTTWVMECHQENGRLRDQFHVMEDRYRQRIAELEKALLERDAKIAQLLLQHQKHFKANKPLPASPPLHVKVKRRGAPAGHPGWHRREPDHLDATVHVPAPEQCPHCQNPDLAPCPETYEHVQEDIVLVPRTRVTRFVHQQGWCPKCRRPVYQRAEGELAGGCQIGPITRALATHLRYDLQIPYRKVQYILSNLFGMPLVPASAMAFDRKVTALGRPLFEELKAMLKSSPVAYADETTWREDGQGGYVWYGGNENVAVYQITDNRSADSAVELLGKEFDGTLVSDDYAAYNATHPKHQQTCWRHIATKAKEILQQIELTEPPIKVPGSVVFCKKLKGFASRLFGLGRQMRNKKLSLRNAAALIPSLQRQLKRFAGKPLDHPAAETLRERVMQKDKDKLFTFLKVKGVDPTNNHSERSVRFLVIMRKICFGTRSQDGSESHGILPSLLQTARRQGKDGIHLLATLLTKPLAAARAALFANPP
jgi:transposase